MRLLYSLAWWLALPAVMGRLWWRGRREPGYRAHLGERLGFPPPPSTQAPLIWLHAVSVGETRAAEPLVEALLAAYPSHAILLTHMTPTGRATGKSLFARHGERVLQRYLPYDTGWMVRRFLRRFQPRICILMETEVWPNMMAACAQAGVPVALVNARLSERSLRKAQQLSDLMTAAARQLACVAAQTEADAARIRLLGAPKVVVTGSVKFDVVPPEDMIERGAALRAQVGARPVLLCASTREGEESLILDAVKSRGLGHALLLIVPRHPQRFDEVAALAGIRGMTLARRSRLGAAPLEPGTQVLLGDSMGEMFAYYAACDLAYIGGSLLPLGGQNLIEACAVGKPVLLGPHTFNFAAVSEDAVAAGAAMRVQDAPEMVERALHLLGHGEERFQMGSKAAAFATMHRGATARTMQVLRGLLDQSPGARHLP
ncbi:lipid IV(A) 3-deoxy-D-manno-octulosonic acid transferase [Noviherbaspirillum galbum]|uniref:3-deoxy-D-manno-octulosonic acid transferase n=1 Tax=Noviherbaspirillum galbum TaxID=2709383 RepID=A0A6B3SSS1_9BURK|nr:lipid IV(A) 3-deoxy-D-manno-octulosonic acid transferase [Noviherbaspirillum galbum]NEX60659.1 3-deoxy-D-manno-octulosonic acid transferase [Noviherbaspirillum galbum]